MADLTKKQYLDLAGLKAFWGIIKDKFVSEVSLTMGETGAVFTSKDGLGNETAVGTIPMATATQAGLMSAAQAKTVNEFADGVAALVPLTAVKVNGTAAELADRAVNLDFIYDSDAKEIQVVDKNNANAVLTKIDATDFIKDGMVSDVRLDTTNDANNLVIEFNTDHGKEDIVLPLDKFIDVYEGTNGVKVEGKVISIVTNGDYLVADAAGLKVADALWTKVGELDTAVATAAATDAQTKAEAAQAAAIAKAGELATAAQKAAEGKAAELASAAETNAKNYTDGRLGDLGTVGEGETATAQTVKGYVDAAIEEVVGTNGSLADVLQDAKDYTDGQIGTLPTGVTTVVGAIEAAQKAAEDYADGLKTTIDGVIEENEKTTAEALNDLDTRVKDLEAIDHDAYVDYVNNLVGTLPEGSATVVDAIEAAQKAAEDYADGLINGENGVDSRLDALEADTHKHDNKTVLDGITADKVAAWDAAEGNAKDYVDGLIGGALAGEGETKTVKGYVDAAKEDAQGYADTVSGNVYAAIEAIPVADITLDNLNA